MLELYVQEKVGLFVAQCSQLGHCLLIFDECSVQLMIVASFRADHFQHR